MLCEPSARLDTVQLAVPPASAFASQPAMGAPLSWNATLPGGVPPAEATVALKVTASPSVVVVEVPVSVVVVDAVLTMWTMPLELLPACVASPAYDAVMAWPPTASAEVVQVAVPPESAAAPQPAIALEPSRNATVPAGVPLEADTVAVKVTAWPKALEAGPVTVVVVETVPTLCSTAPEALAAWFALALYDAVIECAPSASDEMVQLATPEDSACAAQLPIGVPLSLKVTVPAGVPAAEVTVAVNVTAWPAALLAELAASVVEVAAGLTVCECAAEVPEACVPLPEYPTVIARAPPGRDEVVQLAVPAARVTGAQPKGAPPSRNVTVPAGVPPEAAETVAVKLTDWPKVLEAGPVTLLVVGAVVTVCDTLDDVLGMKLAVDGYVAVRLCVPTVRLEIVQVATPAVSACALQLAIVVAPSLKNTVPVGVPPGEVTVAVKVTAWPKALVAALSASVVVVAAPLTVWDRLPEVLPAS